MSLCPTNPALRRLTSPLWTMRRQTAPIRSGVDSGINRLSVSFGMQFANGMSPAERDPQILCYLSVPVAGPVLEIPVPENDAERSTRVVLEGALTSDKLLPKDTQIVFYATCVRKNEFGVPCTMPAGIGSVALTDLQESGAKGAPLDVVLRMPSADWIEKGKLRLTASAKDVHIDSRIRWDTSVGSFLRVGQLRDGQREREQTPQERARIEYINKVPPLPFSPAYPHSHPRYPRSCGPRWPCPTRLRTLAT